MPKRKGKLRSDEFVQPDFFTGVHRIRRTKRLKLF